MRGKAKGICRERMRLVGQALGQYEGHREIQGREGKKRQKRGPPISVWRKMRKGKGGKYNLLEGRQFTNAGTTGA